MKKTVIICDSEPISNLGVRALLAQLPDLAVVADATSIMAGMELVRDLLPGVLIVDKALGLQTIMDWIASLRAGERRTAVVVWGHSVHESEALRLVQAGAQGVVRKTASVPALLDCLRTVVAGNAWMDDLMFQDGDQTRGSKRSSLTLREQQIAELVEQGLKNKEIGRALGICAGTVKIHLKHIFEKTGVRGRYGLALSGLKERGYLQTARFN